MQPRHFGPGAAGWQRNLINQVDLFIDKISDSVFAKEEVGACAKISVANPIFLDVY
jgi:hypothetical protein